eukprot:scaffold37325_cov67-Phaeocystis_antarctica.AAC.1
MGDLLLLAITCVCRLHWSARRGSWSRVIRWGVDFIPMKFLWSESGGGAFAFPLTSLKVHNCRTALNP